MKHVHERSWTCRADNGLVLKKLTPHWQGYQGINLFLLPSETHKQQFGLIHWILATGLISNTLTGMCKTTVTVSKWYNYSYHQSLPKVH